MSGRANCVTEFPKFEIVSPTKNFQKSGFSRQLLHSSGRMRASAGPDHLAGYVRREIRGGSSCVAGRHLR
jgi:hypothetical protein